MERVLKGKIQGFKGREKIVLKGATICASYFDGTPFDAKSGKYCTSSDKDGNFSVTIPDDFYSAVATNVGQKPMVLDLNDWEGQCQGNVCNINITLEEAVLDLPTVSVQTQKLDGTKGRVYPIKRIAIAGASILAIGGITYAIFRHYKK